MNKTAFFTVVALLGAVAMSGGAAHARAAASPSIFVAPAQETVFTDATFEVSFFLDTDGANVRNIALDLKFPADKLALIKPSGGTSFITNWIEPPAYSNATGLVHLSGEIKDGIVTKSGLVLSMTFLAKTSGEAVIEVLPSSAVSGAQGTDLITLAGFGRGVYQIQQKPPDGVKVISETHPISERWYNNNNPILTWKKNSGESEFSYQFDHQPYAIPDNIADTSGTIVSYENSGDGVWYFHLKEKKDGVWGLTTHFPVHIDTAPPAPFTPRVELLTAALLSRAVVSFTAIDTLSGIDHYEVGVIDKKAPLTELPIFVRAESPYQLSQEYASDVRVIVRALDRAGNVRDETVDIHVPASVLVFFKQQPLLASAWGLAALLVAFTLFHYIRRHRLLVRIKKGIEAAEQEHDEVNKI